MKKHPLNYLPKWLTLNPPSVIWYIHRSDGWPLSDVIQMWRDTKHNPDLGKEDKMLVGLGFGPESRIDLLFRDAAHRRYEESTEYYCVNGCCIVIWGAGKRGNMGGYGPAGCSCDDLKDPRDLERGPLPKREESK